jgi:cytochrome b561
MFDLSMRLRDTPTGYGWISIVLHWLTAIVIIAMLFIGSSIASTDPGERLAALNFHTSLGITSYIILWARIVWRFWVGHPGPNERQRGLFFELGKWTHYILMIALGGMLLSGPVMAWASGTDISVFGWFEIPAAAEPSYELRDTLHAVHRSCAIVIFIGVILHIGGVYKHTAFNHDGTFVKMILPGRD